MFKINAHTARLSDWYLMIGLLQKHLETKHCRKNKDAILQDAVILKWMYVSISFSMTTKGLF